MNVGGLVRLRRDGARPLRFHGTLVLAHHAPAAGTLPRYRLALYRGGRSRFAVGIEAITAEGGVIASQAATFDTLDAALTMLEGHDAGRDITPGLNAPACRGDGGAAVLAADAAALHAFVLDTRNSYRMALGEFLLELAGIPMLRSYDRGLVHHSFTIA